MAGDNISSGTLLIEEGTLLPETLSVRSEPYWNGWRIVTNAEGYGLGRNLSHAGWTFVYTAARVKVMVFGFGMKRTLRRGFEAVLKRTQSPKFNCLEITEALTGRFLGLAYVRMSGHARKIQPRP